MKKYSTILFDLDGTLTDSGPGIINSAIYALNKYNIIVSDRKPLRKFIGPPLADSFMRYYDFSYEKAKTAVEYYREYFSVKGIFENELYDGCTDMLTSLKSSGKTLILASSKPEVFVRRILKHFDIEKYFSAIAGGTLDGSRVEKVDVINYALRISDTQNIDSALMVGDREHDVIGASKAGIDSIGVLFGYGTKDELENAHATYIAAAMRDITRIILAK